MKTKQLFIISFISFIVGSIYFMYHQEYILFRFSPILSLTGQSQQHAPEFSTYKKNITFYFWHEDSWKSETKQCLWTNSKEANIKQLVLSFLTVLEEEHIIPYQIRMQAITLNETGNTLFLSFEKNPLPEQSSTYLKIKWIESLLKTIRENGLDIKSVYFLHNHQTLKDPHLDFSQPWPIQGFLAQE